MKRTLCLLRHAKSSWSSAALDDFERPLNERGKADAPEMALRLRDHAFFPELIVASPAKRTRKTAKIFAESMNYPPEAIIYREEIYHQALDGLLVLIRELDDRVEKAMLVGHNPYITLLAEWLSGEKFGNIPTCGLVALSFEIEHWREIEREGGHLLFYDYPKSRR